MCAASVLGCAPALQNTAVFKDCVAKVLPEIPVSACKQLDTKDFPDVERTQVTRCHCFCYLHVQESVEEAVREMMRFGSSVNDNWDEIADVHAALATSYLAVSHVLQWGALQGKGIIAEGMKTVPLRPEVCHNLAE